MNLLLDTHLLLWAASAPDRLSKPALALILDPENRLWFSVANLWEIAIKRALNRPDFRADATLLRTGLLANGYEELAIAARHVQSLTTLPPLHSDPFDRMLVAQAQAEAMQLLTADRAVAAYGGPVRLV